MAIAHSLHKDWDTPTFVDLHGVIDDLGVMANRYSRLVRASEHVWDMGLPGHWRLPFKPEVFDVRDEPDTGDQSGLQVSGLE